MVGLNDIVDNIYVINMKKDRFRLEKFKSFFQSKFKFQIIEGVDVKEKKFKKIYNAWKKKFLKKNFHWKYYINKYEDLRKAGIKTEKTAWNHYKNFGKRELRQSNPLNKIHHIGELGCLLSHISAFEDAIKKKYKNILIFEDDATPTKYFEQKNLKKINNYMENNQYKVIYLGAAQCSWDNLVFKNNFYFANKDTQGTHSYIVHHTFYKLALMELKKLQKPIDNYLTDFQINYSRQILVKYPNMFIQNLSFVNNIRKRTKTEQEFFYRLFKWEMIDTKSHFNFINFKKLFNKIIFKFYLLVYPNHP